MFPTKVVRIYAQLKYIRIKAKFDTKHYRILFAIYDAVLKAIIYILKNPFDWPQYFRPDFTVGI